MFHEIFHTCKRLILIFQFGTKERERQGEGEGFLRHALVKVQFDFGL